MADLKGLLIAHVDVFGALDRLDADGPVVSLTAMSAQYLGMAFHELCTNAAKHGAFAVPGGHVKVRWALEGEGTKETFAFTWQEIGGPKPRKSKRQGFGSKVLNRLAPNALSGCAEIELPETGLVWRVKAPSISSAIPITCPSTPKRRREFAP